MDEEVRQEKDSRGRPWGFWATIGFAAIIAAVYLFIQLVAMFVYSFHLVAQNPGMSNHSILMDIVSNGFLLSLINCVSVPACIGLVLLFILFRKGIGWREYLAVRRPPTRELLMWLGITAVYAITMDVLTVLLGRDVVPRFWLLAYDSAQFLPLFFFALLVAAPLNEEIFFRGFLFAGIRHSVLGPVGAVLIPAVTWTLIHRQYDNYELFAVFVAGIILGIARFKTRSIYTSLVIHSFINAWACIQIFWFTRS